MMYGVEMISRWHDIYILSFMTVGREIQVILRVLPQKFERL
jgi:hypothetical protein